VRARAERRATAVIGRLAMSLRSAWMGVMHGVWHLVVNPGASLYIRERGAYPEG
jgi:hypothetical protein